MKENFQGGMMKNNLRATVARPTCETLAHNRADVRAALHLTGIKAALLASAVAFALLGLACSRTDGGASADTQTERLYRRQCAACHGADGSGGQIGSLTVADLRAPHAVAYTDGQLYQKIYEGGNGMPPFKWSLSEQQLYDLVRFIRHDIQQVRKK